MYGIQAKTEIRHIPHEKAATDLFGEDWPTSVITLPEIYQFFYLVGAPIPFVGTPPFSDDVPRWVNQKLYNNPDIRRIGECPYSKKTYYFIYKSDTADDGFTSSELLTSEGSFVCGSSGGGYGGDGGEEEPTGAAECTTDEYKSILESCVDIYTAEG